MGVNDVRMMHQLRRNVRGQLRNVSGVSSRTKQPLVIYHDISKSKQEANILHSGVKKEKLYQLNDRFCLPL